MNEDEKRKEEETKAMETIVEAVTEKSVGKILEKIKADKPLRKDIFGGEDNNTKEKELADRKAAGAEYFKKLVAGDRVSTKALSAGSSTAGTELVPTYVSDQLITVAQKYGLVRKYGTKWPVQGINQNVPTMSSLTAYRLASDTAAVTASQPTTGNVQLRAKTVGVIVPISKVLLQNSTAELIDAITMLAGKAIAKLEDQWGLLGLGAGEGVFQNVNVPVVTLASANTYAGVTAEDLLSMLDVIDENFLSESHRWALSLSMLNNFRRLRANVSTDKQGFLFEGFGGSLPPTMWDIPYDTTAVMPKNSDVSQASKKCMALVDYSNLIHGDAMEYTVEISDQATITDTDGSTLINLFQQNMVALKIWGQVDIQLANAASAFAVLKTHA
ncbi:MAG TPA: phage major capsid protein [Methylomirabilota bacterium]|nr:phage major capsid protein [Methylomirabilota bacterium]